MPITMDKLLLEPTTFLATNYVSYYVALFNLLLVVTICDAYLCSSFPLKWAKFHFLQYGWSLDNQHQNPSYTTLPNSKKWQEVKSRPHKLDKFCNLGIDIQSQAHMLENHGNCLD